jgi:hypothetical protein
MDSTTTPQPVNVGRDDEVGLLGSIYLAERAIQAFNAPAITLRSGQRVVVNKLKSSKFDDFLERFIGAIVPLLDIDDTAMAAQALQKAPEFANALLQASTVPTGAQAASGAEALTLASIGELDFDERLELVATALFVTFVHGDPVRRFFGVVQATARSVSAATGATSAAEPPSAENS